MLAGNSEGRIRHTHVKYVYSVSAWKIRCNTEADRRYCDAFLRIKLLGVWSLVVVEMPMKISGFLHVASRRATASDFQV